MKKSSRFLNLEDFFTITCKKCGSTEVDLWTDDCPECGTTITATCKKCNSRYHYHDFIQVEVWYEKGKEVKIGKVISSAKEDRIS